MNGLEDYHTKWSKSDKDRYCISLICRSTSLVVQMGRNLPAMQETWVWSLNREDPLEKEMATHSSVLAWSIPWTEKPGWIQFTGSQRVRSNLATEQPTSYTYYITSAYWVLYIHSLISFSQQSLHFILTEMGYRKIHFSNMRNIYWNLITENLIF